MKTPDFDSCKCYVQPILRELTPEQAKLFLVGHAYVGHQGAKELLELLFPLPRTANDWLPRLPPENMGVVRMP